MFFFSNKADKFSFFFESLFSLVIYTRRLPIDKNFGFMGNKIFNDIKNIFIKSRNLLIYTLLERALSQLNWTVGLDHYLHHDSARRLVKMEVDRNFLS